MARTELISLSVYTDPETADLLRRAAADDGRSLSNYLVRLGVLDARARGLTGGDAGAAEAKPRPGRKPATLPRKKAG